ncbi:MAG: hypothetical protein Q4A78_07445 [Peptostreptococcaceae bacterium]|nr:hypothetical protein [Peptostreptococcaceae bacterium]
MDLGIDVKLSERGNVLADAKSEFESLSENAAIMQDICNEAITYEGDLFYDEEYGWSLYDFMHREFGLDNVMLETELKHRIRTKLYKREYIDSSSIQIEVSFANDICTCQILFRFVDENFSRKLSINLNRIHIEVVMG